MINPQIYVYMTSGGLETGPVKASLKHLLILELFGYYYAVAWEQSFSSLCIYGDKICTDPPITSPHIYEALQFA